MAEVITKEVKRLAQIAVTRVVEEKDPRPFGYDGDKALDNMLVALNTIKRQIKLERRVRAKARAM